MTDRPLFAYGTLCDRDVLTALLGRTMAQGHRVPGHAIGFAAVYFPGEVYPALVAVPDAGAPGLLLHGLTPDEWAILDAFEGTQYRRGALSVTTAAGPVTAHAYFPTSAIAGNAPPWTLAQWKLRHKPSVLNGELDSAAALRARLSDRHDR